MGCDSGGGDKFPEVHLDPAEIAGNILTEYDADSDGELSKAEMKKNPGLEMLSAGQENLQAAYRLDSDESGTVSQEELTKRFTEFFKDKRRSFTCTVKYKNKPLQGATVTLVGEPFMGTVPNASGETDEEGQCGVTGEDGVVGAVPGIYRVEITHPETKISPKYNTNTKYKVALDPTNPFSSSPTFKVN